MDTIKYIISFSIILLFSCSQTIDKHDSFISAKEYSDNQDYKNAIEILDKLIKNYPDFDSAYVERGFVKLNLEKPEAALLDLNKAVELDYANISGYFVRALVYGVLQDYQSAFQDYNHIVKLGDKEYYELALKERAILYDYFGEFDKALSDFMILLRYDSLNVETLTAIGLLHNRKHDNINAIEFYNKALSINPDFSDALYKRAEIYESLNKNDSALIDISRAIEIHPNVSQYLISRALIYRALDNTEKAIADLNKAIDLEPENGIAYLNRGYIKEQDLKDKKSAESDFRKAKLLGYDK